MRRLATTSIVPFRTRIRQATIRTSRLLQPPLDRQPRPPSCVSLRSFSSSMPGRAIVPFKLHDIGEGITEVEMLKWHVVEGQTVEHFDDLCEVQSDKSTAELTSPTPGIVHSIKVQEGDTVKVGQTLCEIKTEDEDGVEDTVETVEAGREVMDAESTLTFPTNEVTSPTNEVTSPTMGNGGTDGTLTYTKALEDVSAERAKQRHTTESVFEPREEYDQRTEEDDTISTGVQFTGEAAILPAASPPTTHHLDQPVQPRRVRDAEEAKKIVLTSPAVRSLAGRMGLNLEDIKGTGEKGRITREDVESHIASSSTGQTSTPASGGKAPSRSGPSSFHGKREDWDEVTRVPFGRTRKVMYRALAAQAQIPHFGYSHTLDLTALAPYLKSLNAQPASSDPLYLAADIPPHLVGTSQAGPRQKTTLLSLLVKSMLRAMEQHPIMRAKVVEQDHERFLEIRKDGIIGIAVSDPKFGLVTPSLPALDPSAPLSSITSAISDLRQNPTKMGTSANVVISSIGGLGEGLDAMPVIPPGGPIAICAVGRARWEVEWNARDGGMGLDRRDVEAAGTRAVLRCTVGWSGDHRVLEGAELIAFTESWKKELQSGRLLVEG